VLRELTGITEPPELVEEFASSFIGRADDIDRSEEATRDGCLILPGVPLALATLRAAGLRTAIASSKGRSKILQLLSLHGLDKLFDVVVGVGDVGEGRAKPEPDALLLAAEMLGVGIEDVLYVGDHKVDALAAGRAKVGGFVGVTSGAFSEAELSEAAAVGTAAGWAPRVLEVWDGAQRVPDALGLLPSSINNPATLPSSPGEDAFPPAAPIIMPLHAGVGGVQQRTAINIRVPGHSTGGRVALVDMTELAAAGGGRAHLLAEVWSCHEFVEVFAVQSGVLGFQFLGSEPFDVPAGQTVTVDEGKMHRFRNASPNADVHVELALSPAGLDRQFEVARVLGRAVRAGEMPSNVGLEALRVIGEEVGVTNMVDDEVVPLPTPKL
jgi:phosphoglycolate phosphatase-like HAD superfamily hydrolase/mannose-6-phosphate isomerase-like protein (cupin superfamily)